MTKCSATGLIWVSVLFYLVAGGPLAAQNGRLVINANTSDPAPKAAFAAVVDQFRQEQPGIEVEVNYYDHESYKTAIRNWLTSAPPDIVMWNAGNRMRQFAKAGLLADMSDLFTPERRRGFSDAAIELVSFEGRQYGIPYSYYNWGIYYRVDLLEDAGLAPPSTWDELMLACEKLKAAGIQPISIGTRDYWPAGGWFDYIDLRLNGIAFHMELMSGSVSYRDEKVKAVFETWRELIERRCFNRNHAGLSWQQAQALLFQGKAAMTLIGSFMVPNVPADLETRLGLVAFPAIAAGMPRAEEAPMNSIHVPARAANLTNAMAFAAFMMRDDVQSLYNKSVKALPANLDAAPTDSRLLQEGRRILETATGFSQFIDRDTHEELAGVVMRGLQEFMLDPGALEAVLDRIEQARTRIFRLE